NDAFAELNRLDLTWETVTEDSNDFGDGIVIRTQPGAGELVRAGDTITVVVSSGPSRVEVPDLFGLTFDQAQQSLEDEGLAIGDNPNVTGTDNPDLDGRIINQTPPAGAEVDDGSTVQVTIGHFEEPPTTNGG
ncbi:MAG: PASTA domain-containing protein, partial [Acidimicrobiia bacterium]